jgi:hypothetical protein
MTTKGILDLFGYVLDGIRGAGHRGEVLRAKYEIDLAIHMLAALKCPSPSVSFSQAIAKYRNDAEAGSDDIMMMCSDRYEKLMQRAGDVTSSELDRVKMPYFDTLNEILRIGLGFALEAHREGDLHRVEIEADHLHNVPTYLTSDADRKLDYFIETEHPFYLDRIEQSFGKENRLLAEQAFESHWRSIMT